MGWAGVLPYQCLPGDEQADLSPPGGSIALVVFGVDIPCGYHGGTIARTHARIARNLLYTICALPRLMLIIFVASFLSLTGMVGVDLGIADIPLVSLIARPTPLLRGTGAG